MNADFFNEKSQSLLPLQRPLRSHAPRSEFQPLPECRADDRVAAIQTHAQLVIERTEASRSFVALAKFRGPRIERLDTAVDPLAPLPAQQVPPLPKRSQ